jgi:predicted nucleotidyltransferase
MNAMAQEVPQAAAITGVLRSAGARFAFVFGSRARGETHRDSDTDIAAFFGAQAPQAYEVLVPPGVDLLVLDDAPLELAGRVAMEGVLLFDDAPEDRVAWLARTRKIYADERYRFERAHREFAHAVIAWRHDQ